jgi:hypothetical protein
MADINDKGMTANTFRIANKHELVVFLQELQSEIQQRYSLKISHPRINSYDMRGIWIVVDCGCGHNFHTPYHIPSNGKCKSCGKNFFTFQKAK